MLPREIILEIASFINKEYVSDDYFDDDSEDDGIECSNLKKVLNENGSDGHYYPIRNLYATCHYFKWLSEFEYVCVENGEFHSDIVSRNINGVINGMLYNAWMPNGLFGYASYINGNVIDENIIATDCHYFYRYINGIKYFEHSDCKRWWNDCVKTCKNCIQLDKIQREIFSNDPAMEEIFKANYDNGIIIPRIPKKLLTFNYCADDLKLAIFK